MNLGNPREFTMVDLARTVIRLTGSASQLLFEPLPQDDPRQRQPDITEARQRLGWEPTVELESGLRRTIGYFQQLLQVSPSDTTRQE